MKAPQKGSDEMLDPHRRWQDSPDGVRSRLSYLGENLQMEADIIQTLIKLPREIRNFALERCRFVSVGRGIVGITLPGKIGSDSRTKRTRNMWIIVLDDNESPDEVETTIAHEIAHAWRGDDRMGEMDEECEEKAAAVTRDWGFQGRGADPEFQRERNRRLIIE
jgi:hypothetical protein